MSEKEKIVVDEDGTPMIDLSLESAQMMKVHVIPIRFISFSDLQDTKMKGWSDVLDELRRRFDKSFFDKDE